MRKIRLFLCLILLLLLFSIGIASAKTWYVDDSGGADFTKIQDTVNAASDGDTIIVKDGTYTGNVKVDKRLTIRSENGAEKVIIRGREYLDPVFEVTSDYVNIIGFTIEGIIVKGQYYTDAGIYLASGVKHCSISYNNILNNEDGIILDNSSNNKISNNNALSNNQGIYLSNSFNNTITNNSALNNDFEGIRLLSSSNNIITNNKVLKNDFGFYIYKSSNNNIINNNNIRLNIADGIVIESASNNEITKNNINSNGQWGISVESCNNNKIYLNNFINNTDTTPFVGLDVSNNWNSPEEIPYTYSGNKYTNYLGNYWGDYEGSDENNDGIGDTPYVIEDYRKFNGIIKKDKYPLMTSFENYVSIPEMPFDTINEDNTRLILYGVVLLIIVAIGCGIPASRRKRKGWHEQKIKEYKAKVEQWKREGYKVDELVEMLK
jgi:parallel beta-helix repeat protein